MAVVNTKSVAITNADASPMVITPAFIGGAVLRRKTGLVEIAAGDDDTSVFRMVRVRSSDVVDRIIIHSDAITAGTAFEVGLHKTAAAGGAVVDADLFASAITLATASTGAGTDVTYEATATNIDKLEKRIWELLGLTEDPLIEYDLTLTGTTVGSAAGTVTVRYYYVDGNA